MLNAFKNILNVSKNVKNDYIYSKKPHIFTIYNPQKKYLELVKKNDKKANDKKNQANHTITKNK